MYSYVLGGYININYPLAPPAPRYRVFHPLSRFCNTSDTVFFTGKSLIQRSLKSRVVVFLFFGTNGILHPDALADDAHAADAFRLSDTTTQHPDTQSQCRNGIADENDRIAHHTRIVKSMSLNEDQTD